MSYWISVRTPPCSHCGSSGAVICNVDVTRNVSPIVEVFLGPANAGEGYSWWRLRDKRAGDVTEPLRNALAAARRSSDGYW